MELGPNPTTQEAYEFIRAYFSRPNAVLAKGMGGSCLYRTDNGDKCAVGCMISDEAYEAVVTDDFAGRTYTLGEMIENRPVDEILGWGDLHDLLDGDTEEGQRKLGFLKKAQNLHDIDSSNAADFVERLDVYAEAIGLQVSHIS